jgi:hypothetical protein
MVPSASDGKFVPIEIRNQFKSSEMYSGFSNGTSSNPRLVGSPPNNLYNQNRQAFLAATS